MNMKRKNTKCTHLVGNLSVILVGAGAGGPSPSKPYRKHKIIVIFDIFSFFYIALIQVQKFFWKKIVVVRRTSPFPS
jgi:hypothetical protein